MNTDHDLQRRITGVFANEAPSGYPEELLGRVLTTTSRTRPRPTWLADIKEPPMRIPARVVVGSPTLRLAMILALTLVSILAAAGAVVAAASMLPSQPRLDPYGPAANGALVYGLRGDISLADADGANSRPIITGTTIDNYPWFSHDGRTIAFGRGRDGDLSLMVANADGTDVTELLRGDWTYAEFMPSDDTIAVTHPVDGRTMLSIVDVDGNGTIRKVDLGDIELRGWVMPRPPDGAELIFTGRPTQGKNDLGIFAIKPDGTGLRTIGAVSTGESGDDAGTRPNPQRISFQDPVLSPDGSTIAYWSWEPGAGGESPDAHLHLRDLTSGEELPLPFAAGNDGSGPHYSPDGTMMVYEGPLPGLTYVPVDGSLPGRSIGPEFSYLDRQGFDFSPDGQQVLLYLTGRTIAIDVDSGEWTNLTDIKTVPSWQRLAP
jgi:hypothetical protein